MSRSPALKVRAWGGHLSKGYASSATWKAAAHSLGVQLQTLEAQGPDEFERAFAALTRERAGALLVPTDGMFLLHRARIVDLAAKSRLPAMYGTREFVDAGGLMVYGASL